MNRHPWTLAAMTLAPLMAFNARAWNSAPPPEPDGRGFGAIVTIEGKCRGVKIAPRRFLTATHCSFVSRWKKGDSLQVEGNSVFSTSKARLLVSEIHKFRGFDYEVPFRAPDLTLIETTEDIPGLPYAQLARSLPKDARRLIYATYNCPPPPAGGSEDYGYLYLNRADIVGYHDDLIALKTASCSGDSGGPLFLGNSEVIGILSGEGDDPGSPNDVVTWFWRLDSGPVRAWLNEIIGGLQAATAPTSHIFTAAFPSRP